MPEKPGYRDGDASVLANPVTLGPETGVNGIYTAEAGVPSAAESNNHLTFQRVILKTQAERAAQPEDAAKYAVNGLYTSRPMGLLTAMECT